jgi:hypothetical protein
MIRIFAGHEEQEKIGFHVFLHSVIARASQPVAITPLAGMGLPRGTNAFTVSRFLVPYLMDYHGHAIFADASDMLCLADIAELDALFDPRYAVQCVQHPTYQTRNPVKYIGTAMECRNTDYPRKNWASCMILNCSAPAWRRPMRGANGRTIDLLQFRGLHDDEIGTLPNEWNRLVDEGQPVEGAKIAHWSSGIPFFPHYTKAPGADLWHAEHAKLCESP